jgi:hypothetical protein
MLQLPQLNGSLLTSWRSRRRDAPDELVLVMFSVIPEKVVPPVHVLARSRMSLAPTVIPSPRLGNWGLVATLTTHAPSVGVHVPVVTMLVPAVILCAQHAGASITTKPNTKTNRYLHCGTPKKVLGHAESCFSCFPISKLPIVHLTADIDDHTLK